jgi:hypothetical protein
MTSAAVKENGHLRQTLAGASGSMVIDFLIVTGGEQNASNSAWQSVCRWI